MQSRVVRAAAIHGMAGMAAYMASTYKAYLGEGLGPAGEWVADRFKIPHPGRVAGQAVLKVTMPGTMSGILGGYRDSLAASDRVPACRLDDAPHGFAESLFPLYMEDDDALLRACSAYWTLVPVGAGGCKGGGVGWGVHAWLWERKLLGSRERATSG